MFEVYLYIRNETGCFEKEFFNPISTGGGGGGGGGAFLPPSCFYMVFLYTLALDAWILSKFSTLYWICLLLVFLILVGVELPLCL